MLDGVEDRVKKRLTGETYDETIMSEIIQTVTDRLCLRLGVNESTFPSLFDSIVVDASIKLWRRRYYEGIASENVSSLSDSFVEDILNEYQPEIDAWLNSDVAGSSGSRKVVRFL